MATKKEKVARRSLTVSLPQALIDDLNNAVWEQRLCVSHLVEALIVEAGKRLDPPLPFAIKSNSPKPTEEP